VEKGVSKNSAPEPVREPAPDLPPSAPSGEESGLFDYALVFGYLGSLLRAPVRHKWLATAVFLAFVALGVLAIRVLPFQYQVQAKILARRNLLIGNLSNPTVDRNWDAPTQAAREVLVRRDNLISLCKQTDFINRYLSERAPAVRARDWLRKVATGHERDPNQLLEDMADTLDTRLKVFATPEGIVTISFDWSNPETARRLVEAAVQSFLESRYASEISAIGETIAVLQSHDARLKKEIAEALARVTGKQAKSPAARVAKKAAPVPRAPAQPEDENVTRLKGVLSAKQRALADLEAFRRKRLEDLQVQLSQQLAVFAPRHPEVLNTRQSIDALNGSSPQVDALRNEIRDLENELSLREVHKTSAPALPVASVLPRSESRPPEAGPALPAEDPRLDYDRNEAELLLRQHSFILDRIDAAEVEMDTAQAAFKYRYSVISPPQLPQKPIKSYRAMILVVSVLSGLVGAVAASMIADHRSGLVLARWQLERRFGLQVLAQSRKT